MVFDSYVSLPEGRCSSLNANKLQIPHSAPMRATRHGCFATAADFHPQASLAALCMWRNDGPQPGPWQNIMAMAATLTIGPTFAPHGHTKLAMLSTEEHFVTCFWAGLNVCLEIHLPHQPPQFDRTPDSTTHFIHNCPVKDVPPVLTTRLSKKKTRP